MKICMMTDLEGVAGVVSFENQSYPTGKYYEDAKRLLTAEVNAAVDGLLDASVEEVLVMDFHGPGGIRFEDLHPAATLLHGRPMAPRGRVQDIIREHDACVMIGQHAMAGTEDGNLNHTQSSRAIDYIKVNSRPVGETAQFALQVGALGLPVIFLSGDEAACREAEATIPGITTVAVKRSLSRQCAVSLSRSESHRRIREGIRAAVEKHKAEPVAALVWKGPFVVEKRFFHTETADAYMSAADVERVDSQTVRFRSDDILKVIYR